MLLQRIDSNTAKIFGKQHPATDVPDYNTLYKFLSEQCLSLETHSVCSEIESKSTAFASKNVAHNKL